MMELLGFFPSRAAHMVPVRVSLEGGGFIFLPEISRPPWGVKIWGVSDLYPHQLPIPDKLSARQLNEQVDRISAALKVPRETIIPPRGHPGFPLVSEDAGCSLVVLRVSSLLSF